MRSEPKKNRENGEISRKEGAKRNMARGKREEHERGSV